ncbi:uncharacterized protein STEHIDRAFT_156251 [Stereum hirsutum FP-91666 SS1]|uniref:uncharacterized protein n=1 Tax=Stereum hirsutum (strain FP-91666) TaxID=721885 RepID=UPI000440D146|nr:uncharacterized protein STEHIDRAFT_156251 [Stereum hirsutum FP-91666 SS1]EIM87266.1 hypothetical protein STEHIDRAFT_156251 [Stereum hirsutum FP-91666 SS1]
MSNSEEIIESSGLVMPQGDFASELGRELYRKLFSFPPGDPRADEWIKGLTKAERTAFIAEVDRELKEAEEENATSVPRRYWSYTKNVCGFDMDAAAWEYGVMDGNWDEVRMRRAQERQAEVFQTATQGGPSGAVRDLKVLQARASKGR